MARIDKLTPDQEARVEEWAAKWVKIGLSTEPADFDNAIKAALRGYGVADLGQPMVILRVGSPYAATVGGALAWLLLRNLPLVKDQVRDQVWDPVRAQVRDQVWVQAWDQVGDQVRAQVWDQVGVQARVQVWDQVGAQVRAQVRAQVGAQVRAQVGAQVRAQVWVQVWDQVGAQVRAQVRAQVGAQVRAQVRDQVRDQVWDQVGDQVWDQVWDQVGAQVGAQVRAQVRDQVRDQVWDQVGDQVWDQVRAQVWDQVRDQVWDQVRDQVGEIYTAARQGFANYGYDAIWSIGFVAWVSFFRDVCGWQDPILEKFSILETIAKSCGWTWWHQNILAISDRPRSINRDERGRLHNLIGPAMVYPDGWAIHAVHGVRVPAWIIEHPEQLTAASINAETNAEVRRVMLDKFGVERYIRETNASIVDQCDDSHPVVGLRSAKLYSKPMNDDESIVMLDMLNSTPELDGTTKRYMIRIDPKAYGGVNTCLAAMASTYRDAEGGLLFTRPEDYAPTRES